MYSEEHSEYLKGVTRRRRFVRVCQILLFVAFFALWELAAQMEVIDSFIFSRPSRMVSSLLQMMQSGELFRHIGVTMAETVVGFLLSTLLGTAVAVVLWWNDSLRRILNPYLVVLNSLPKTALAPILIVIFGNNVKSIIATALMTTIVVTVLSVLEGFLSVDSEKVKLVQTFGGNKRQILGKVIFPANIPCIINALKINVGLSFVGVIVGEFMVAKEGLGYLIIYGSQIFKMDWVMLSVLILCALAAIMYQVICVIERKFLTWSE